MPGHSWYVFPYPNQHTNHGMLTISQGAMGIYPTIPNTLTWCSNNVEGVYKRGVIVGTVVGWGNLNGTPTLPATNSCKLTFPPGVVSSNIFLEEEEPRYWTGHGTVLAYQIVCLLGGTIFVYTMLRIENRKRRSGQRDNMLEGKTATQIWIAGDKRPDFIYTL